MIYVCSSRVASRKKFWEFLEYDHKNNTSIWREYMRIKVRVDVRKPLNRKKKIIKNNKEEVVVMYSCVSMNA